MANDGRRGNKVKEEENSKSKKKTVTPVASPVASPVSSSRRSSRETSTGKQTPVKEDVTNTRKSERLDKKKQSGATPVKGKSGETNGRNVTLKKDDRGKKSDARISAASLRSRSPVSPATRSMRSEKEKVVNGGRKRKRVGTCLDRSLSKPLRGKTEEGDDNDKESADKSSEACSSGSSCRGVEKPDNVKAAEDKDDSGDDCGDSEGEESDMKASETQSMASDEKESLNDRDADQEQDRTPCEAVAETLEKNNGVSKTDTSVCVACKKLRCYHLPLVMESIWDTREVELSEAQGLQKQKQYLVKYKGLAHIHNQWITETQLLLEAPLLAENYIKNGSVNNWNEEWTMPQKLLNKRLLLSLEPVCLSHHYEWLVRWQGLNCDQDTWESESISFLDSPEGHNLLKDYEKHLENEKKYASSDIDRVGLILPPGMDNIHLSYVKNLHEAWSKGQNTLVFDDQERTTRIVLFILSLKPVYRPFLLLTKSDSLSQWETMFSKLASLNAFTVSVTHTHVSKLLHVRKEGGELAFQLLLYPVDAFIKDLNVLKAINWEAVIVDESQSSNISSHFRLITSLSTDKRLLVFCDQLGVSNLNVMALVDCGVMTETALDVTKLKEYLSKHVAYECKSTSSKFVEYWVPVQISNVQLEQYCSMLLSNAMVLSACSKSDPTGALHDILVSNRKCCDHPYIVDQSLQAVLTKDLELAKILDVGIKASGKLQFLDVILPEMRKRQLRVLILFQPLSGSGKDSTSIGDILDDFIRQRFGVDSYERVDGIGMIPSKKQAALKNFNNKEMDRFIFLLEHRACLPSIKLSSIDTIIIFDSDWNPANDLRALQRIAIDSDSEQTMIFRLYTSLTLEEKVLRHAHHNVTIDSRLQNISRNTIDELLMWDATYLFKKLDEFHSDVNNSDNESWRDELMEEFLDLISYKRKNKEARKLKITRAESICGKNVTLQNKVDGEQPHTFWRKLLSGKNPSWKYLSVSTPRHRITKRPQYFEESPKRTNGNGDDVARKRKKITNDTTEPVDPVANNISDPFASKPVIEGEITKNSVDPVASEPITEEVKMSFLDILKLKISKLCEVLKLPEDVKIMVEKFLEYVIENYRVNKEPENTLHSFLISLCWIGSELLKHKLDRKQSISLAKEHLDLSCSEEEANTVCLKLELAKDMFLLHNKNLKKKFVDIPDTIVPEVKIEISDSLSNHNNGDDDGDVDGGIECNQKDCEVGTTNPDTSNALKDKNNNDLVQPIVSPAPGQSVPADLANEFYSEASLLQPDVEPCLPSENHSSTPRGEQQPDSQNPVALESSPQVPSVGVTPPESDQFNGNRSGNFNQGGPQKMSCDPLQAELERLCELNNTITKFHDAIKVKIKSDHEKELAETIAQINAKYEAKSQSAETAFQLRKKEVETYFRRVIMNKVLAETFRSKCQDLSPISPADFQAIQSGGIQHLPQFQAQGRSNGVTSSSSPAQSPRSQQVTGMQPPLQIVDQSSKLFSPRPPSNDTNPSTMSIRPPPSPVVPTITPNKPPSTTSRPINPFAPAPSPSSRPISPNVTPSSRPMNPFAPSSKPIYPNSTPSSRPIYPNAPSSRPFNPLVPSSRFSRPPPNITPVAPYARNSRGTEIRAQAPHMRQYRLPTSPTPHEHRVIPSQRPSSGSSPSQSSARPVPSQTPHFPTNHNSSPTQNPPRSSPLSSSHPASVPAAQSASSQRPLYPWYPPSSWPATPSSHPQTSLPPMPSVPIRHTGLYNRTPTPDLRMDIDKQSGFNPPNRSPSPVPSPSELSGMTKFGGKEGGGSNLVCLSDDDDGDK